MGQYLESALLRSAGAAPAPLGERAFDFDLQTLRHLPADGGFAEDDDGYQATRNGWIFRARRDP
jgi:hypothetical protein